MAKGLARLRPGMAPAVKPATGGLSSGPLRQKIRRPGKDHAKALTDTFAAMKLHHLSALLLLLAGLPACVHTPPGTSVKVALAQKPEVVRLPGPPPGSLQDHLAVGNLPIIEPELPGTSTVERVGEAFSRGQFCMEAGKDAEAIAAFEEAVKIDPSFTEAWHHLAILYAKVGQEKKSIEAFHRAKKLAQH